MNEKLLNNFRQLISDQTGLFIRHQDNEKLRKAIAQRLKILKKSTPEEYYRLLAYNTNHDYESEWKQLTILLTTAETFFFLDKGQFDLLRHKILPELIDQRKFAKKLRIWSAGCSSGEEPYSLAILVQELIPALRDWDIVILGTDINKDAIEKAKRGTYGDWSFRMVDPQMKNRYFESKRGYWAINDRIRKMVTFQVGNLLKDIPPPELHDMDLILCRNVFIYFDRTAIGVVIRKFAQVLKNGGYLITGHSELYDQTLEKLKTRFFPESIVYQRDDRYVPPKAQQLPQIKPPLPLSTIKPKPTKPTPITTKPIKPLSAPAIIPPVEKNENNLISEAKNLFKRKDYETTIKKLDTYIKDNPPNIDVYYLMAEAYANLARYEEAVECCGQALKIDTYAAKPYYLLAHIAEEQGNIDEAKDFFKKIMYVDPDFIPAYLDLASIYESEGNITRAKKMRETAVDLLKKTEKNVIIEPYAITAIELLQRIQNMI